MYTKFYDETGKRAVRDVDVSVTQAQVNRTKRLGPSCSKHC